MVINYDAIQNDTHLSQLNLR